VTQRIIGLTGGIATGKTTVANYLAKSYHLPILDADIFSRDAITPNLLDLLQDRYGSGILLSDRILDRAKLGAIIFNNSEERTWLESQIHPYIRHRLKLEAEAHNPNPVAMVVPLLFEAGMQDLVTETWVVACSPELEIERLMQRDRLDHTAAKIRIASQMSISEKIAIADFSLDNSTTLAELFDQVDRLMDTSC
jgi:dephospho-CoA kinase